MWNNKKSQRQGELDNPFVADDFSYISTLNKSNKSHTSGKYSLRNKN